jgi:hypothetical protein
LIGAAVHLVDDLAGEPAREGVSAHPGVMARLAKLEERTEVLVNRVGDSGRIARLDMRIIAERWQVTSTRPPSCSAACTRRDEAATLAFLQPSKYLPATPISWSGDFETRSTLPTRRSSSLRTSRSSTAAARCSNPPAA